MAKQILATPVSTVVMKEEFRVSGKILDSTRSSLSLDSIQVQVCLDDWTKTQYRQ